jgi:hypothetical protein
VFELTRQALDGSEQDYTRLPLRRAVFLLALPMVMEMAMESLFAVADIFWVSKLGADAVATVGLTESLMALVYSLAFGLSMAGTATVSRRVGEGDWAAASHAAGQIVALACVIGIALGVAGAFAGDALLELMGATESVQRHGRVFVARAASGNHVSQGPLESAAGVSVCRRRQRVHRKTGRRKVFLFVSAAGQSQNLPVFPASCSISASSIGA